MHFCVLEALWTTLRRLWTSLGASWGALGALLAALETLLGPLEALLGRSWAHLGASWRHLGKNIEIISFLETMLASKMDAKIDKNGIQKTTRFRHRFLKGSDLVFEGFLDAFWRKNTRIL